MQTKKPIVNPVVVLRKEFDDWAVLFNPDTAEAVGINPVGVAIWELLIEDCSMENLVENIKKNFAEVPGTASDEIQAFINDLTERAFIGFEVLSSDS
jgi:SynChlorMet cassette protein ScmD